MNGSNALKIDGIVRPVAIVGPTATGKTAVGIELARRLGGEIISADSMAIYRGMDIGTAKPSREEQQAAQFHLIDVVDPNEPFTVSDFQDQAAEAIDRLASEGKLPLIVGGTGLYIRAALDGLNIPGPGPDPKLRDELERLSDEKGSVYLHGQLSQVDPETAARLHPNDAKRIIRALEVYKQTGVPMSKLLKDTKPPAPRYPDALQFGLSMDRELLYKRIEDRIDLQLESGLIEEVKALLDKGYDTNLPAMQGLGYKQIAAYLKGEIDYDTALYLFKRDTRRFAKRQFTWFRGDSRIEWLNMDELTPVEAADIIEAKLAI